MIFNTSAIVIIIVIVIAIIAAFIVFKCLYLRRKSFGGFRESKMGFPNFKYDIYPSETYESRITRMIRTYGYVNIAAAMKYFHANVSYDMYKPIVYVDPQSCTTLFEKGAVRDYRDDIIEVADYLMPFLERVDKMESIKNNVKYFHIDFGTSGNNYVTARGFEIIKTLLSSDGYIICSTELFPLYFNYGNKLLVFNTPDNSPDTIYRNYDVIIPDNQPPAFVSEDPNVFPDYTSFVRDGIHYRNNRNKYFYTLSAIIITLEHYSKYVNDARRRFILNVNGLTEEDYERIKNDRKNITREEFYLLLSSSFKLTCKEDVSRYILRDLTDDETMLFDTYDAVTNLNPNPDTSNLSEIERACEFDFDRYIDAMVRQGRTFRWYNVFPDFWSLFHYLVRDIKTFRQDPHDLSYALLWARAAAVSLDFDEFYDVLVGWGGSLERVLSGKSLIKFFALKPIV